MTDRGICKMTRRETENEGIDKNPMEINKTQTMHINRRTRTENEEHANKINTIKKMQRSDECTSPLKRRMNSCKAKDLKLQ